mmetsp:Transcript_32481/g.71304  ORF Transcript_32481/g.71304 Transcript_32481/m.71304 type:complete len:277 (-) Transcript_32481:131-961(-)|eukprot:CAMPEP_0178515596 /NCGR_PEP_ID=MMETSP0696-20121128/24641_1 /TAXON_ID=265572 /ORGANISM="Extubocellulus spinifer, Strain CCMP396" /LENGTH=276 /DNA_ID=CAMNT_0020145769 /DNA_START=105 /DNA_END=935 /DNA_ORIENTATION=+
MSKEEDRQQQDDQLPSAAAVAEAAGSSSGATATATLTAAAASDSSTALHKLYPINSFVELTLGPGTGSGGDGDGDGQGEKVSGLVYCTDAICNTVVLRQSLVHTTLVSDVRFISADSVVERKVIKRGDAAAAAAAAAATGNGGGEGGGGAGADANGGGGPTAADLEEMARQLPPPPTRRALEEREKRALKLAEDSLLHINDSASPLGQATFDKLLKACNEVVWEDSDAIVVLGQVRVDAPYGPNDCKLIRVGKTEKERGLAQGSLERVKKIVAHEG